MYVEKNIDLNQEFYFAHSDTKLAINKIYNSHFSGSPLWDLFGIGARNIETSYNKSVKYMLDLPYATHRYLIESLNWCGVMKMMIQIIDCIKPGNISSKQWKHQY